MALTKVGVSLTVANIPALSSVFVSGEHASQRASRGMTSSIPHFVQHVDTQASETPLPYTTDTIIKTSPVVTTQDHDPESNPDDGKPTYGV